MFLVTLRNIENPRTTQTPTMRKSNQRTLLDCILTVKSVSGRYCKLNWNVHFKNTMLRINIIIIVALIVSIYFNYFFFGLPPTDLAKPKQIIQMMEKHSVSHDTIFISIASFKDPGNPKCDQC